MLWPKWDGSACAIVASGPSAVDADLENLPSLCKIVAINDSWRLAPHADLLYACDAKWWVANRGLPAFGGLRVSGEPVPYDDVACLDIVKVNGRRSTVPQFGSVGRVGSGYCSGFQALNLVAQLGVSDIILVGYDARMDASYHWHGAHAAPLTNPRPALCALWQEHLDAAAPILAARGVRVSNASARSALKAYPKTTVSEWAYGLR